MPDRNFMQMAMQYMGLNKPDGFNAYGLGAKHYGGGRTMPNIGAVGTEGRQGYAKRDAQLGAQKQALLNRMQASNRGAYGSADYLRGRK